MAMTTAVVLYNLGGPDAPDAVRPFLFNLFYDKAIIGAPNPIRWLLATALSRKRAPIAQKIYAKLGGGSPILPNTQAQANALQAVLGDAYTVLVAMRYWHPFTADVVRAVKKLAPTKIVLMPLYPQFSTTTTGSFLNEWRIEATKNGLDAPVHAPCCYPTHEGWIQAVAASIRTACPEYQEYRILFSAHGLPQKIVDKGDPYAWQVEQTTAAVAASLKATDYQVCYQSRVGPLKWLEPSTETALKQAGADARPVVLVPIAFVSEHSETLVEMDEEYQELAHEAGVPAFVRTSTVAADSLYINALAQLVKAPLAPRQCPKNFSQCPQPC